MHQTTSVLEQIRRLGDEKESGTLALSKNDERVDVFYREGMIEAVSSNSDLHRLGQYLVKEGWLQSKDLDTLLSQSRRNNMLFGEAAICKKYLEPPELSEVVRLQAMDLLNHAVSNGFTVDAFTSTLHAFYVPAKITFAHVLLEFCRREADAEDFQLPDPAARIQLRGNDHLSDMPWYPQELSVLGALLRPIRFDELLTSTRMPEDALKRILGVLSGLELIEVTSASENDEDKTANPRFPYEQMVPVVANAVSNEKLEIRQNASSFVSEQFKNLKVRVSQADSANPIKVLAISSAESQEGKSLVSSNLAFAFSMDPGRRVIVVDCDLRNPTLDKYLGVPLEPGLLGYLTKSHLAPYCFVRRLDNLFFMSTGGIAPNPIELLSLGKMKELIAYLRTEFDTIVLDAPPFSPIADARVITALSDGMVMVVRSGKTSYNSLERAFKLADKKKVIGVVFNDVKPMLFNTYHHYGYYQYGQYGRYPYYSQRKTRSAPKNYLES